MTSCELCIGANRSSSKKSSSRLSTRASFGTVFYSFVSNPIRATDGTVRGFVVVAVEITELVEKRMEADTRRAEAEALAGKLRDRAEERSGERSETRERIERDQGADRDGPR